VEEKKRDARRYCGTLRPERKEKVLGEGKEEKGVYSILDELVQYIRGELGAQKGSPIHAESGSLRIGDNQGGGGGWGGGGVGGGGGGGVEEKPI